MSSGRLFHKYVALMKCEFYVELTMSSGRLFHKYVALMKCEFYLMYTHAGDRC